MSKSKFSLISENFIYMLKKHFQLVSQSPIFLVFNWDSRNIVDGEHNFKFDEKCIKIMTEYVFTPDLNAPLGSNTLYHRFHFSHLNVKPNFLDRL